MTVSAFAVYAGNVISEVTVLADGATEQILVFDVGGSHIACAVFGLRDASITNVSRIAVNADGSLEQFAEALQNVAAQTLPPTSPVMGIALAMPNPFDYKNGVSFMKHKYQHLYGINLRSVISNRFNCDPASICFLNDASAFLLGELSHENGSKVDRTIGITLGTGIGSAFGEGGEVVDRGQGVPDGGEIWNLPYRGSIVEEFISTRGIQTLYYQLTGRWNEVLEIAAAAAEDVRARQTFELFGHELGKVLREKCALFAADRIVLGGGIAKSAALFLDAAELELKDFPARLAVTRLFDQAPLLGVGVDWMKRCGSKINQ